MKKIAQETKKYTLQDKMRKNKYILGLLIVINLVMIINNVSAATSDMTYVFTINYKDGKLSPESLNLFDAQFSEFSNRNEGEYRTDLVNKNNVLYSVKFDFELIMLPSISAECIDIETGEVVCDIYPTVKTSPYAILNLPYFENADSIKAYKGTELLFSYPIPGKKAAFNYLLLLIPSGLIIILVVFVLILMSHIYWA